MLKSSVVTNTWSCDNCSVEATSPNNPFHSITVAAPGGDKTTQMDLCDACISLVTPTKIVTWVEEN